MKTIQTHKGPFKKRPYYEQHEIEQTCANELHALNLLPKNPEPIRIDRFIEKRFGITPEYRDLPVGVLGYSQFGKKGVEAIVVAKSLDSDSAKSSERRLRTTLAHESGHVLLQGHLFALGKKPVSLFNDGINEPQILCRESCDGSHQHAYDGKWWEFQANQTIGPLLLPKILVEEVIDTFLMDLDIFGTRSLPPDQRDKAVQLLAEIFNVNPAAAKTRLDILYPIRATPLLTL